MPIQTPQDYYENEPNWGKYAYITLKEVIDELLTETTDPAGYLANTKRSTLLVRAKNGIQTLSREVKKTIHAMEATIGPKLFIPLPQDYIDWVRVSMVGDDYKLKTLNTNSSIPTAVGYLQDNEYELLFDSNGEILMADSSNIYNKEFKKYEVCNAPDSKYGEFVVDEERGVMGFSSDLEDREIVLEYVSDGLEMHNLSEKEISIHKSLKQVLIAYVFSETLRFRRGVLLSDKRDALNRYKALLHRAKMDNLNFNIANISGKIEVQSK